MHLTQEHHVMTLTYQHGSSSQRWIPVAHFLGKLLNQEFCYDLENAPYCTKMHTFFQKSFGVIPPIPSLKGEAGRGTEKERKGKEGGSGWEGKEMERNGEGRERLARITNRRP
jgi:hypothetical protein